jgi:hypothetical protein
LYTMTKRLTTLNSSYVMLGGGLVILPGRNFARFNLMLYILFCMVLRTAYQGVQFDMMLKEIRPKNVETIDELIDNNFKVYGENVSIDMLKPIEFEKKLELEYINNTKKFKLANLLIEGSKNAFVTDAEYLKYIEVEELNSHKKNNSQNKGKKFVRMKQRILSDHLGFKFPIGNFMAKSFNKKIGQMFESGLTDFIIRNVTKTFEKVIKNDPPPLSLKQLKIWFFLFLILLGVGGIVLALEICIGRMKREKDVMGMSQR